MIFDKFVNCNRYYSSNENFNKAFDFIKKAIAENLPVGKYEIDGEDVFASVQEYVTKLPDDAKFEGHRKYIDIQFIVSGQEKMLVFDIDKAVSATDYNKEKDVEFFMDFNKTCCNVVENGEYCIFFPNDIHKPGLAVFEQSKVKKVLVKIKV